MSRATAPRGGPPDRPTVLVAGAAGFLGRAVTAALVAEGYPVRGLVRDAQKAELVRSLGANVYVGDVTDPATVQRAVAECDAVIQLAATYPEPGESGERAQRVRVEGTRNLGRAARAAGARRLLVGSGYWVYADQPGVLTDDAPLDPQGESRWNYDAERAGLEFEDPGDFDVVVVRPGMVYGDGSWFRGMLDSIRAGTYRYPGRGENYWSLVELHDAATAYRTLLERGSSGTAYLVVDDRPITVRELATLSARAAGAASPTGVSPEDLRAAVGDAVAHHLAANRAGSNLRLRGLGWAPRQPDSRRGVPELVRTMRSPAT